MSKKSNEQGRAYEYACLITLHKQISKIRKSRIIETPSVSAAKNAWDLLTNDNKNIYSLSALAAVFQIFEFEPRICEQTDDEIELYLQSDNSGKNGDVRDILIIRADITWEIGLSLKHNNFAVKHSRLSPTIDFGKQWFGFPCSDEYWNDANKVFNFLSEKQKENLKFSDLSNKEKDVYIPLLKAFAKELRHQAEKHREIAPKLVEYLLGKYDFYKVISVDRQRYTQIQGFNIHRTLNKPSKAQKPISEVPIVNLPTRIVYIDFAENSSTTIEVYMDKGWQFTFRIHNASTLVQSSLKFDIQIVGMPTAMLKINCFWK